MAWSLVQQQAAQSSTTSGTLPAGSTAGNLLVAVFMTNAAVTGGPAGWTAGPTIANGGVNTIGLWYDLNCAAGLSSFAFTTASTVSRISVAEFTCPNVATLAGTSDTGTGTAGAVASETVTTSGTAVAGDLVIAGFTERITAAAVTWTDPTGFTQFAGLLTASAATHTYAAYKLSATSGGAQSVAVTSTVTGTAWAGAVMTFTQPAAAAIAGGKSRLVSQAVPRASLW